MNKTLNILGILSAAFALIIGTLGHMDVMIVGFFTSGLFFFIGNLDKISEFKASTKGFEAKTREVINEARGTITELQELAKIVSKTLLSLVVRMGRWGKPFSSEEEESIKSEILKTLDKLNLSEETKNGVLRDVYRYTVFDYSHYILGNQVPSFLGKEGIQEWTELRHKGVDNPATPEDISNFLKKYCLLNEESKESLEDYNYYLEHKKHRRPEVWNTRGSFKLEKQ